MKTKLKWEFKPKLDQYRRYLQGKGYEINPPLQTDGGAYPKKELILFDIEDERTIIGLLEDDYKERIPLKKGVISLFEIQESDSLLEFTVSLLKARGIPVPDDLFQLLQKDVKMD